MTDTRRLPVQHPNAPHCPTCDRPLPNLNSALLTLGAEAGDFTILGYTLHIRCVCGSPWDILKTAK